MVIRCRDKGPKVVDGDGFFSMVEGCWLRVEEGCGFNLGFSSRGKVIREVDD